MIDSARETMPETIFILGPNHTGLGPPISVYAKGRWKTPLGEVRVDESFANKIVAASNLFAADQSAHMLEHSIEVQLPFLQFLFEGAFEFVPICMRDQTLKISSELGEAIGKSAAKSLPLIIASTDFTH